MQKTVLHIGMPRTATTFLQQKIFPQLPYQFFNIHIAHYSLSFQNLLFQDDNLFNIDKTKQLIYRKITSERLLISNENFVGQSLFLYNTNRTRTAERLKSVFPNAAIVVVLRNQLDLLRSLYEIDLQWHETKTLDDFVVSDCNKSDMEQPKFKTTESHELIENYDYLPLIKLYKSLFDDVTILFYEDLKNNPLLFAQQLQTCLKVDFNDSLLQKFSPTEKINAGLSKQQAEKLRRLNKWYYVAQTNDLVAKWYYFKKRQLLKKMNRSNEKVDFSPIKKAKLLAYFSDKNKNLIKTYPDLIPPHLKNEYYID